MVCEIPMWEKKSNNAKENPIFLIAWKGLNKYTNKLKVFSESFLLLAQVMGHSSRLLFIHKIIYTQLIWVHVSDIRSVLQTTSRCTSTAIKP